MALHIQLVGLNHRSAPIDVLEQVSFTKEQLADALPKLVAQAGEAVILSTCNRTEIYTVSESPAESAGQVRDALSVASESQSLQVPQVGLFHAAVRTGRRVREETDVGRNALSISYAGVRPGPEGPRHSPGATGAAHRRRRDRATGRQCATNRRCGRIHDLQSHHGAGG